MGFGAANIQSQKEKKMKMVETEGTVQSWYSTSVTCITKIVQETGYGWLNLCAYLPSRLQHTSSKAEALCYVVVSLVISWIN